MRLLKINGFEVEMDGQTAIGIDVENLDLTAPKKRFTNSSNSFSIPATIENLKAIRYLGGFQNKTGSLYDSYSVEYYLNNEKVIIGSYAIVQGIDDRIDLQVISKPTLWDNLKALEWDTFAQEYFDYLVAFHNIPDVSIPITESYTLWINRWLDVSDGALKLYPSYTNEMDTLSIDFLSARNNTFQMAYLDYGNGILNNGGHYYSDALTLFKFIEYKYSVDFNITSLDDDNIFTHQKFIDVIWLFRNIKVTRITGDAWYFGVSSSLPYCMKNDTNENGNGNIYDLVISLLNIFGVVIEEVKIGNYKLHDISHNIDTKIPVNISLKLDVPIPKVSPSIKGYGQESIIKYSNYSDGINSVGSRKIVECNNKNIQFRKDIIKIDNFVPASKDGLLNYGVDKSFDQFKIATLEVVDDSYTYIFSQVGSADRVAVIARVDYKKPIIYDLEPEWAILDRALNNPLFVQQKVWLTPTQYSKINNWTLYYIPELSGSYYVNKIKGYNPDKSRQSVTLDLIHINNKTP